jgi:hypothetical protein
MLSQSLAYWPPLNAAEALTDPQGSVGKTHETTAPLVGEQLAIDDDQLMDDGVAVHSALTSAQAPGCTGPLGLALT